MGSKISHPVENGSFVISSVHLGLRRELKKDDVKVGEKQGAEALLRVAILQEGSEKEAS